MAKTDLTIPSLGNKLIDLRDTLPGDSYNWNWVRPLPEVNYLAIHHSAGPDTQTAEQIANYHISSNGWGGIGYHFLVAKDGTVYYVGDISTARANVANLNEQVIGICLVGNFMGGKTPTNEQIDSTRLLCEFFISNFPDLSNLSWDKVRGHKELPNQSTACPGDTFKVWKNDLIGDQPIPFGDQPTPETPLTLNARRLQIAQLYRLILGRNPDEGGLSTYAASPLTIDEIRKSLLESEEHQNLIKAVQETQTLKDQLSSMQTSLASINQQVIILQENLQEREQEIAELKKRLTESSVVTPSSEKPDTTLTIIGALITLYKFIFPPRKEAWSN